MTPYMRRKLQMCQGCKHHVSAHRYDAEADTLLRELGLRATPGKCSVPECECERFIRPLPRRAKAEVLAAAAAPVKRRGPESEPHKAS